MGCSASMLRASRMKWLTAAAVASASGVIAAASSGDAPTRCGSVSVTCSLRPSPVSFSTKR